jgi:CubicO group peptidase (beta-lactamase class C family)
MVGFRMAALFGLVLALAWPAVAQGPAPPPAPTAAPAAGPPARALTADDAGAWLDGLMPYALSRADIAGAVVVVVKDGQVLVERGYGHADVAEGPQVDPERTLFRPGSISKLFTWTAVMQLVEAGKLNLDQDVNAYLDFRIRPAFGKPITLRNLMTHTAGFEETARSLFASDPSSMLSLERYVKHAAPARIFPPGTTPAYSNYGAALAGYIVQRVSGEPFDAYIQRHIFTPLGMTHSTFEQPLPAALAPEMSQGYQRASAPPRPFELVSAAPAGALSSTGADMARFMIAHLNGGALGTARILRPETAALMHAPVWTPISPLPPMALGFYHEDLNGHRVIGHAGDTGLFHSDLHLFLDDGVGVFVSFNSLGVDGRGVESLRQALLRDFADRYFPAPTGVEPTWPNARQDARVVVGQYQSSRRSESNFLRLLGFFSQQTVTATPDGVVTVSGFRDASGALQHWREVGPFVWREVGGRGIMAARVDHGRVVGLSNSSVPPVFWLEPVAASQSSIWGVPLLLCSLAVVTYVVVAWPLTAWIRRRYGHSFALKGAAALGYRLARVACLAALIAVAAWIGLLISATSAARGLFDASLDPWLLTIEAITLVAVVFALVPLFNLVVVWRDRSRGWWAKTSSLIIVVATLSLAWFAVTLRLAQLNTHY